MGRWKQLREKWSVVASKRDVQEQAENVVTGLEHGTVPPRGQGNCRGSCRRIGYYSKATAALFSSNRV